MAIKKLGILVGGGPAPGINGAIAAAALEAIKHGCTAIGFHDGLEWLTQRYTDEQHELTVDEVSRIYISIVPVIAIGIFIGFLSAIMGVGGGFIMVPAMIYILKVPTNVVVGTSLFQIIFVSAYTTMIHATANNTVDVVLASCLMIGGVAGAQYGANVGQKLRGEQLRALLALLVISVALRLAYGLFITPDSIYTISSTAVQA